MSAIADFRLIKVSLLTELPAKAAANNYVDYLDVNSKKLEDFPWSGYIFADLLIFLEKKGISLLKGEYETIANQISEISDSMTIVLTFEQKQKYITELASEKFTRDELIEFNKGFSEVDDPELANAELAGIKALRKNLELLTDNTQVILLSVG